VQILLASDHDTVRQGLRLLLEEHPDLRVIAEAGVGQATVERAATLGPDVVVIDLTMVKHRALLAIRELRMRYPALPIVALTPHAEEAYILELLGVGVSACVLTQSDSSELIRATRVATAGEFYLDTALADRVTREYVRKSSRRAADAGALTDRESQVLRQIAWGFNNKQIAAELSLSVKTIELCKASAMRKLALQNRHDIVRYAVRENWLRDY
jgi:two-component system response regulator NreC